MIDKEKLLNITYWIFDLDDTLYPHNNGLWEQIDQRISNYLKKSLSIDDDKTKQLRHYFRKTYGGALKGLMEEYNVDVEHYLQNVHDIDYSVLNPNPDLCRKIEALPGKKLLFTNGDRLHAQRTLLRLGLENTFDDIFDIVTANLIPKPFTQTYQKLLDKYDIDANNCLFAEDNLANLKTAKFFGITTAHISENNDKTSIEFVDMQFSNIDTFTAYLMKHLYG